MAAELGLCLNKRKSEIICKDPSTLESILAKVPDLRAITPEKAFLLGAPLGDEVCFGSNPGKDHNAANYGRQITTPPRT